VLLRSDLPVPPGLRVPALVQLRRDARAEREGLMPPGGVDARALVAALDADRRRYVDFLRRRVGADAEDLYQQCLLRAFEHVAALHDPTRAAPWFWRVLRNAVADHHGARVAADARAAALRAVEPESTHESAAACACALGLLPKLPAAYGEILRRVDVDDERVGDVARDLGITADNASVRLHRARKALRERLAGCCRASSMRACFACDCADETHRASPREEA